MPRRQTACHATVARMHDVVALNFALQACNNELSVFLCGGMTQTQHCLRFLFATGCFWVKAGSTSSAILAGDSTQAFLVAVVVPDEKALKTLASELGITGDLQVCFSLVAHTHV
jgi:hypothetical protein